MGNIISDEADKGTGWKRDEPDHRDIWAATPKQIGLLKPSVSLINDYMPSVYDQKSIQSSTANALTALLEYDMKKCKSSNQFTPSRMFLYYCQRKIEDCVNYDQAVSFRSGLKVLKTIGVCSESEYPYNHHYYAERPSEAAYENAKVNLSTGTNSIGIRYKRVKPSVSMFKVILSMGYPICFGMNIFPSFNSIGRDGIMQFPVNEELMGGIAVVAVGYNSTHIVVRNSYGQSWGDNGYFYIPHQYLESGNCDDCWILSRCTPVERNSNPVIPSIPSLPTVPAIPSVPTLPVTPVMPPLSLPTPAITIPLTTPTVKEEIQYVNKKLEMPKPVYTFREDIDNDTDSDIEDIE